MMSRIIKTQNGYRIREKALKLIGVAISEFSYANNIEDCLNIAAFIALSLDEIENSVRETADAWEKRDYWVKADQFRSEWGWVGVTKSDLVKAVLSRDLNKIGEVFESLRKKRKVMEGMINPKKGMDYAGSFAQLMVKFK